MAKRNFWLALEIRCMLRIFKEFKVLQLMEQKRLPIHEIYRGVEREMIRRGFNSKNARQIQNKWSQLKSTYLCAKRNHNPDFYSGKDLEFREEVGELVESQENQSPAAPLNVSVFIDRHGYFTTGKQEDYSEKIPGSDNLYKQGSYKKTFWKFLHNLKSVERDIQDEFINRQRRLLEKERNLQIERNLKILNTFVNNTDSILKTSNYMLAQAASIKDGWSSPDPEIEYPELDTCELTQ